MPILRLLNKLLGFSLTGSALGTSIGVKITKGWKSVLKAYQAYHSSAPPPVSRTRTILTICLGCVCNVNPTRTGYCTVCVYTILTVHSVQLSALDTRVKA